MLLLCPCEVESSAVVKRCPSAMSHLDRPWRRASVRRNFWRLMLVSTVAATNEAIN